MQNAGTTGSYTSISDHYAVLIQSICDISESYHYLGKLGDALNILKIGEQHNYKLEASYAARHLAGIFADKEDPKQGLKFALESLTLREDIGFKRTLPASHLLVGMLYYAQNDLAHALLHYHKALELAEEMELKSAVMSSLLAIGDIHLSQKDVTQAQDHFEKAYALAQELDIAYGIAEASEKLEQLSNI